MKIFKSDNLNSLYVKQAYVMIIAAAVFFIYIIFNTTRLFFALGFLIMCLLPYIAYYNKNLYEDGKGLNSWYYARFIQIIILIINLVSIIFILFTFI